MMDYRYHSDPLHNTVVNSLDKACSLTVEAQASHEFKERMVSIIDRSFDAYEYLGHRVQDVYYRWLED